jgi:hypothetical protein
MDVLHDCGRYVFEIRALFVFLVCWYYFYLKIAYYGNINKMYYLQ